MGVGGVRGGGGGGRGEDEERDGEEAEEVRGDTWAQGYSQLESGGLGDSGELESALESNGGEERCRIMAG